jgi:methyltransferase
MGEGAWLVAFLIAQRLVELCFAQLNTRRLRGMGGIEFGAAHYPLIVILHATWIVGLLILGRDRAIDPFWLAVFIVLQIGRLWVIASLGRRWTTRVIVMPGAVPVARGPYRWLRHPNYLIVALEIAVVPLALGLPVFALTFSAANAALLAYRIRIENEAMARAAQPT